jgi:diacylglycerol kinase (ATP)
MDAAAHAAATDGSSAIVIVGGDGTVNRVVNAIAAVARKPPVGLIPLGTGNDLARAIGLPRDPLEAARRVLAGQTVALDLVAVNGMVFCTAGLLGVPAASALSVREWFAPGAVTRPLMYVLGGLSYSLAGLRHVLRPGPVAERYEIVHPGGTLSMRAHGVFVANTPMLGGGLVLPIGADATDGLMEIALITEMPRWRLLAAFARFARGWPLPPGTLQSFKAARAEIRCEGTRRFSADGDQLGESDRYVLSVMPGALRVFV